jgi:hypothetical protein
MLRKRSAPIGITHHQEEDALELAWMLLLQILVIFDVLEISAPSSIIVVACICFLRHVGFQCFHLQWILTKYKIVVIQMFEEQTSHDIVWLK